MTKKYGFSIIMSCMKKIYTKISKTKNANAMCGKLCKCMCCKNTRILRAPINTEYA